MGTASRGRLSRLARRTGRAALRVVAPGFSPTGITGGLVMQMVASRPSLIPRTAMSHSIINGLCSSLGYIAGASAEALTVRATRTTRVHRRLAQVDTGTARRVWLTTLGGVTTAMWLRSLERQRQVARLVDMPEPTPLTLAGGLVGGSTVATMIVFHGRVLILVWRRATRLTRPFLPRYFGEAVAGGLVLSGWWVLTHRVVARQVMERVGALALANNGRFHPDVRQPQSPLRSGSPASYESWESLGNQGRWVMADGPSADLIARVTGGPAVEPIRVYAGKIDGRDLAATAAAVVAELDRTRAWDRSVLMLYTSTGTGWVQEWAAAAIEYLTGGDCAVASMQYSYVTSGIAFVSDRHTPVLAGTALWQAVQARLAELPPDRRPKVYVSGESLGAYGGLAAFSEAADMLARVDGAVWVGTPSTTPIHEQLTAAREPGSPVVAPIVDGARQIRFAGAPEDLHTHPTAGAYGEWELPRVVFAQHPSDPVVWGRPDMLWREPGWMREPRGRDVSPAVTWWPWVTMWQFAGDMPLSITPPGGYGHNYHEELVAYWAAVLGGDPRADVSHIAAAIRANRLARPPMLGSKHAP